MTVPQIRERTMRDGNARRGEPSHVLPVDLHHVNAERALTQHPVLRQPGDGRPARQRRQRNPPPAPGLGEWAIGRPQKLCLSWRFGQMYGDRQPFGPGQLAHAAVEWTADGVRRMGRYAESYPGGLEAAELGDPRPKSVQALARLIRMRPEHLLVRDARPAALGERPDHHAAVPGVCDGGDPARPAVGQPPPGRGEILLGPAPVLELAQSPDPGCEVVVLDLASEAGELEVGVNVDEAGNDRGAGKVACEHTLGPGDAGVRSDSRDAAVRSDEDRAVRNRLPIDREDPAGCEPDGRHLSRAAWSARAAVRWAKVVDRSRPSRQARMADRRAVRRADPVAEWCRRA